MIEACSLQELIKRGQSIKIIPEDFSLNIDPAAEGYPSSSEAIASELRLNEDQMYTLLGLEYGIDALPQELMATFMVPAELGGDENLAVYRREGFVPVEKNAHGRILIAVSYPFGAAVFEEVEQMFGDNIQIVFCNDRVLASIFTQSVMDEDTAFGDAPDDAADQGEDSYFLGSEDEEEMFPGIYGGGGSAADLLYQETESQGNEGAQKQQTKTNGFIQDLGFLDMLQMMSQSRKTGTMTVKHEEFGDVYLFFDEGQIVHCITDFENGEEGFYRIVGMEEGSFEIVMGAVDVERTIHTSTDGLILEGLRRLDEAGA